MHIRAFCDTPPCYARRCGGCLDAKEGLAGPLSHYPPRPTGPDHSKFLYLCILQQRLLLVPGVRRFPGELSVKPFRR